MQEEVEITVKIPAWYLGEIEQIFELEKEFKPSNIKDQVVINTMKAVLESFISQNTIEE